jgi:hypothetical protein
LGFVEAKWSHEGVQISEFFPKFREGAWHIRIFRCTDTV